MSKKAVKIPFELHLTVSSFPQDKIEDFATLCQKLDGKHLIIELAQGEFVRQPMFVKTFPASNLSNALEISYQYSEIFSSSNFEVCRIKIETQESYSDYFHEKEKIYFEWHGKIRLENLEGIIELCKKHKVHLSRNSLNNEKNLRFVTLREFRSQLTYSQRLSEIKKDLQVSGIEIVKESSELCIYDNNQILDKGWLPK